MEIFNQILSVAVRSLGAVVVLFIISRISGPRQISQLNLYDYIVGISIGSIAAMAVENQIKLTDMFISMAIFGGFAYFVSWLTNKSMSLRRIFDGRPSIMIYKGKIIIESLKKNHFNINDLIMNCRKQGYFKLSDIEFAILEIDGQFSVMPRAETKPLTPKDMSMNPQTEDLEYSLIIDGEILDKNLKCYGKDKVWLNAALKKQKINSAKEVLLATGDSNDNLNVFLKNEALPHNNFFM